MEREVRIRRRDRRVTTVRRITAWAAAGSLAVAAMLGAIFGVGQAATTGSASKSTTTTGKTSSTTGSGLKPSTVTPSSSSTAGTVTSGGS